MSYDGGLNFGLVGDYDELHDLDDLAVDFMESLEDLGEAAHVSSRLSARKPGRASQRLSRPRDGGAPIAVAAPRDKSD